MMNTNNIDNPYDDPQLTAFALGELEGDEATAIEARLETDENARAMVDEVRQTAGLLADELASELTPALTEQQRNEVVAHADEFEAGKSFDSPVIYSFRHIWAGVALAAAACIVVAVWVTTDGNLTTKSNSQFAKQTEEQLKSKADDQAARFAGRPRAADRGKIAAAESSNTPKVADEVLRKSSTELKVDSSLGLISINQPQLSEAEKKEIRFGYAKGATAHSIESHSISVLQADDDEAEVKSERERNLSRKVLPLRQSSASTPAPAAQIPVPAVMSSVVDDNALWHRTEQVEGTAAASASTYNEPNESYYLMTTEGIAGRRVVGGKMNENGGFGGGGDFNREAYARIHDNPFTNVTDENLSTFSIDVDTASYSNMRRFLNAGQLPPPDAVRIEELINYFSYDYDQPAKDSAHPFAVHVEIADCPWAEGHRLARIGLKGREIDIDHRPATNLVFLLDVSGSMNQPNKLSLVKQSMRLLIDRLNGDDRIAIVVYAGASGLVLDSTYANDKQMIFNAIERLQAGGSTNGGAGIELAYSVAAKHYIEGGANRVILCTDGDFNVGVSSEGGLVRLIEEKRETGVFLSVLGFGTGNFQDARMEQLSNHGNGTFAYIDTVNEAKKVLVDDLSGTLVTIAKDVKIQVDFNPRMVGQYRLIGYENRILAAQDFNDDKKDAGEIGAGHTVTALYEIVPPELVKDVESKVDDSKYVKPAQPTEAAASGEMMTVKLRYKLPDEDVSTKIEFPIVDEETTLATASADFKFAAAVAGFGMILRDSPHKGTSTIELVMELASAGEDNRVVKTQASKSNLPDTDYRAQFIDLVTKARSHFSR